MLKSVEKGEICSRRGQVQLKDNGYGYERILTKTKIKNFLARKCSGVLGQKDARQK